MKKFALLISFSLFIFIIIVSGKTPDFKLESPIKDATITSQFGMRIHPIYKIKKLHKGVDYKVPLGTPVMAAETGKVVSVKYSNNGYGNQIIIQHNNTLTTLYAHLSEINVKKGIEVQKGKIIGTVGNSGFTTTPHLHFEVHENGSAVDPKIYLAS